MTPVKNPIPGVVFVTLANMDQGEPGAECFDSGIPSRKEQGDDRKGAHFSLDSLFH